MFSSTSSGSSRKVISEINITPLTDIFLVLLIIMMVVAPLTRQSPEKIQVPEAEGGSALQELRIVVDVSRTGDYFVNGRPVPPHALEEVLVANNPEGSGNTLVVRGDGGAKSTGVLRVLEAARHARFESATVAVQAPEATSRD